MKQKGLSLLELLVVIGIIAVLGAIALPQYNKYVTKARITEALHAGQVYAKKVEAEAAGGGGAGGPPSLEYATIEKSGDGSKTRVVISLNADIESEALIDTEPDESANGKVLELAPTGTSQAIRWACTSNLPASKIPQVCAHSDSVGGAVAWTKGSGEDACWSPTVNDGGGGWAVGSCAACNQIKLNEDLNRVSYITGDGIEMLQCSS